MSETLALRAQIMGGPHDGRTLNVEATVPPVGTPMPPTRIILAADTKLKPGDYYDLQEELRRYAYDFVGFSGEDAVYHYVEPGYGAGPGRPDEEPTT
jgi:hypothetical protein